MELDSTLQVLLMEIYDKLKSALEVSVSSPEYKQSQIDAIISAGLVKKIDASSLSGWEYILHPTYEGEAYMKKLRNSPIAKLGDFLRRGEEIGEKEYHPAERGFAMSYVSGPLYDAWMDEINIFNERYLKKHPMHDQLYQTYFHRRNQPSAYSDISVNHCFVCLNDNMIII